jgi:glutamine amidotransferase
LLVAVIDYGSGNLASAARGLAFAAAQTDIKAEIKITSDPDLVAKADRIILPGQGAFADCAAGLRSFDGLQDAILTRVAAGAPFLGICVGMQLMAERGLEHQTTPGFGWIKGDIAKIPTTKLRLPHMGWNELIFEPNSHPLLNHLTPGDHAYFVHSYALATTDPSTIIATTEYDGPIPAIIATANRAGTQFHTEKSQTVGLRILGNFLSWVP